jgi:hypothetical protein
VEIEVPHLAPRPTDAAGTTSDLAQALRHE